MENERSETDSPSDIIGLNREDFNLKRSISITIMSVESPEKDREYNPVQDTISVQGPACVQKTVAVRVRKRVFRSHARATPAKFCKALQSSPVYFKAVRLCTSLWKAVQGFFHDDLWLADPKLIQADPKGIQADPS